MVIVIFRISEIGLVFIALEVLRLKSSGVDRQGSVLGGKNSVVFFLAKEQKEISSLVRMLTERGQAPAAISIWQTYGTGISCRKGDDIPLVIT